MDTRKGERAPAPVAKRRESKAKDDPATTHALSPSGEGVPRPAQIELLIALLMVVPVTPVLARGVVGPSASCCPSTSSALTLTRRRTTSKRSLEAQTTTTSPLTRRRGAGSGRDRLLLGLTGHVEPDDLRAVLRGDDPRTARAFYGHRFGLTVPVFVHTASACGCRRSFRISWRTTDEA